MAKGSWAGAGCAALCALPFCAGGIATIYSAQPGEQLPIHVAAGSAFLLTGLAIIFGVIALTRATAASFQLRKRYPDQPWMWREDWAANTIADQGTLLLATLWFFAVIWNLISLPLVFAMPWREVRNQPVVIVIFLFPAIGVLLLFAVLFKSAQRMKYGASTCHIDSLPIVPGRTFHGELTTRVRDLPERGFDLKLTCTRRTGSGKSTNQTIVWQETQTVLTATPGFDGARVSFTFGIPSSAEVSDGAISWRLEVAAEVPGIDYSAAFDLPVYAMAGQTVEAMQLAWPAPTSDPMRWTPAPESRIAISAMPSGGEEYRVGPAAAGCFGFSFFLLFWFGIVGAITFFGAPLFFTIVFVALGLLVVAIGIDWVTGRSVVRADRQVLAIERTTLVTKTRREVSPRDITGITTTIGGTNNGVPLYHVVVRSAGGNVNAAKYIRLKSDAEMLAARMRIALGV